jgi:hypothetical protein
MESFLAGGVPDLITEYAVFEATFLCEECSADCGLFVGLEFVVNLSRSVDWERKICGTGDYIRSEGRRKICQRQLRLGNDIYQYYVGEKGGPIK